MNVNLKTFWEMFEPFAYKIEPINNVRRLISGDGKHIVIVSNTDAYLSRWKHELNKAFERGLILGLSAGKAIAESKPLPSTNTGENA